MWGQLCVIHMLLDVETIGRWGITCYFRLVVILMEVCHDTEATCDVGQSLLAFIEPKVTSGAIHIHYPDSRSHQFN